MAKIRSTVELLWDSRNGKSGIVQLEINEWTFNPEQVGYVAKVNDYLITTQEVEGGDPIEIKRLIISKPIKYSSAQIDGLFSILNNPITIGESYTQEMDNLIAQALLYVTQQDPIYESESGDWEII